jgi:hypothetical protein
MPCDSSVAGVTCTQSGSKYTWTFRVGTGDRRFSVRAKDAAGNMASSPERLLHLAQGTNPTTPPPTTTPPTTTPPPASPNPVVSGVTPADGTVFAPGDQLDVTASVTSPSGANLGQVVVYWTSPGGTSQFPMTATSPGSYTLSISISAQAALGSRTFYVQAMDASGNVGKSATTTVSVQ